MARKSLYEDYVSQNPLVTKPEYQDSYGEDMKKLYEQIAGREPFQYDAAKDPLYQGYKNQYVQQGKLAMKDTMGQAAALTGGYSNTYGQSVGQQAYDAYLQKLGEVIPSLYSMAYGQYKDAGDQMLQQYSLMGDLRDQEYGRYRDALNDWTNERAYLAALEQEDYNREWNDTQFAYQQQQDAANRAFREQQFAYQQSQDAADRAWREQQFEYQKQLDAYEREYQANRDAYEREMDAYQRAWNEENRAYQREQDAYQRAWNEENRSYQWEQDAYNRAWDKESRAYDRAWNEENRSYQRSQDAYSNLYSAIASSGYRPSNAELEAAGMSRAAADAIAAEYQRNVSLDDRDMAMREWSAYGNGSGGTVYGDGWYTTPDGTIYAGPAYYPEYYDYNDLWRETQNYYNDYGQSATYNRINQLYAGGYLNEADTATAYAALTMSYAPEKEAGVVKAALDKMNQNKSTENHKIAGETLTERRRRLGI